jgi:large subunit ribosomal protein L13
VDAEGQILGRLATRVAVLLRGKHKPQFTPHMDMGDFVIVINADKVKVTGQKENKMVYRWHSMHPGGLKERSFTQMRDQFPERIIELAVKRMLPKNRLGKKIFTHLKVYKGSEHPHAAQQPAQFIINR